MNKLEENGKSKSKMVHLEKFLPKVRDEYYANLDEPQFDAKERQNRDLVKNLLHDEKAYAEFLSNILIHVTGVVKLDRMNRPDGANNQNTYSNVVTVSDEAYAMTLLEDKTVLWREVLKRRRASESGDGTISMGVRKEITISDMFGDKYTLYSNGGVFSPEDKKGWSVQGVQRCNYYYEQIKEFRASTEGKEAMIRQRSYWSKSPIFPNKKRKAVEKELSDNTAATARIRVRCLQEAWV